MPEEGSPKKADPVTRVAQAASGAQSASVLSANVIVGVALGWLLQKAWPSVKPWGLVAGLLLGVVSGFYQLFKLEARWLAQWKRRRKALKKGEETDKEEPL